MLTPQQKASLDQALLEPDDLADPKSEIDQLSELANAVTMLLLKAKEIEEHLCGCGEKYGRTELLAYSIRCNCECWRERIAERLRRLNR